ncbi:MAG: hypothetical protein AAF703_14995 [Cyanobacteria bacterium P01_D01_bin.105]
MLTREKNSVFFRGYFIEVVVRAKCYLLKGLNNPNWLLMSILGRFGFIRNVAVALQKSTSQKQQTINPESVFTNVNVPDAVEHLNKDGLYLGVELSQQSVSKIRDFALSVPCYGNRDAKLGFLYTEKDKAQKEHGHTFLTAQYYNTSLLCSEIRALGNDSRLIEIASRYLKAEPLFTGSRLWWNFAVNDEQPYDSSQTITFFHYDLDDYACVRFFFYLTDVDAESGPHTCVLGSHRKKSLSHVLMPVKRRSDDAIIDFYGSDNIVSITGATGFGFAEDTFCYHKATRPLRRDRLMLQIQFATRNYGLHNDLKDFSLLKNVI